MCGLIECKNDRHVNLISNFVFSSFVFVISYLQVDGKKHSVPSGDKVSHYVPWNKEMDLTEYHSEMDKKYF